MAITEVKLGTPPDGVGGDTPRSAMVKINSNFGINSSGVYATNENAASRLVGTAASNVMEVGAFGLGSSRPENITSGNHFDAKTVTQKGSLQGYYDASVVALPYTINTSLMLAYSDDWTTQVVFSPSATNPAPKYRSYYNGNKWSGWTDFLTTANTTKDANGFIKAASPIIKLFGDKIELNDEAAQQEIVFEKLGVGDYIIKGSTGFAQEGWYIEAPKDANGNVLVAVVYKQLPNNDISVKTYSKVMDKVTGDIGPNIKEPKDIPPTRWIDIRLKEIS